MRRHSISVCVVVIVMAMFVASGVGFAKNARAADATWTYAIYMDGDNNLETYWAGTSLPLLEAVPASTSVNIVAFVDLGSTSGMQVQKISGTTVTTVLTTGEMNMGDPAKLTWCLNQAAALFPSPYLAVTMWDHGYAWNYVCLDDTSEDSLSMPELQNAIAN